jgi:hypothetical protein
MADEVRDIEQVVADAQVVRAGERRAGFPDQTLFWSDDLRPVLLARFSRVVYRACPTCARLQVENLEIAQQIAAQYVFFSEQEKTLRARIAELEEAALNA